MALQNTTKLHQGRIAFPTIALFILLGTGYLCLWVAFSQDLLHPWIIGIIGAFLAYGMFTVAHEASHGNISGGDPRVGQLETLLGWLSSATLLAPFGVFKAIHLEHHAHTNDPEHDPDHYVNGKNALDILFRCLTVVVHYYARALGRESHHNVNMKGHRMESLLFIAAMLVVIGSLILLGYGLPLFFVFILPAMIAAPFLGFAFDWLPHFPHHNMGKDLNTRIITIPGLEYLLLFQSYHLIHHLHPRVPFYRYKLKFREIESELKRKNSPVEGWRKQDGKLMQARNTYHDIAKGTTWKYALKVSAVEQLTHDAAAIHFENVGDLPFQYKAGQYVVVSRKVNYEKVSRCYSICSNPREGKLVIGVKRVPGGLLSNKLLDTVEVGQSLHVAGPFGEFGLQENRARHVFIAGGSGITPILSMIYQALTDTDLPLRLIYGCRSENDVMFKDALEQLATQYPERFELLITYDVLRAEQQQALLKSELANTAFYICGPTPMIAASKQALQALSVDANCIVTEEFALEASSLKGEKFRIQHGDISFEAFESETILEASRRNQLTLPHACGMGQCGTCKIRLKSGEVKWKSKDQSVLLQNEQEAGYILSCMCQPISSVELEE